MRLPKNLGQVIVVDRACQRYSCTPADLLIPDSDCAHSRLGVIVETMFIAEEHERKQLERQEAESKAEAQAELELKQMEAGQGVTLPHARQ